jgi:hypothetical protein
MWVGACVDIDIIHIIISMNDKSIFTIFETYCNLWHITGCETSVEESIQISISISPRSKKKTSTTATATAATTTGQKDKDHRRKNKLASIFRRPI